MAETEWVQALETAVRELVDQIVDDPSWVALHNVKKLLSTSPAPPVAGGTRAWRCFHCDEVFTDIEDAAAHFMLDGDQPACCLAKVNGDLAKVILTQQKELAAYRNEDTATIREVYGLGAKHFREMRSEEEKGYARGLADGRNESLRTAAKVAQARAEFEFHPENADFLRGYETGYKAAAQAIVLDIRALSPSPPAESAPEKDDGLQSIRDSIRKGVRRSDHRFRLENPSKEISASPNDINGLTPNPAAEEITPETERLRKALDVVDHIITMQAGVSDINIIKDQLTLAAEITRSALHPNPTTTG